MSVYSPLLRLPEAFSTTTTTGSRPPGSSMAAARLSPSAVAPAGERRAAPGVPPAPQG